MRITLEEIRKNEQLNQMVDQANACLAAMGYTDHGPKHVGYVSKVAAELLEKLGYPEREVELAAIAGWLHDVGNICGRKHHGQSGGLLLFPMLLNMGMPMDEVCTVTAAVANHEESVGNIVNNVTAALVIADKVDAHRVRVRQNHYNPEDIHDRVNYAIGKTYVKVDAGQRIISYEFIMDATSSVMDFMEIYLSRMLKCEEAARFLNATFQLKANGVAVNNQTIKLEIESQMNGV